MKATPLLKKILILWGGILSGLVCILVLRSFGGTISGGDHPILVLLLLPLLVWYGIASCTIVLDSISEFKWKLLGVIGVAIVVLLLFPVLTVPIICLFFFSKLIRDTYYVAYIGYLKQNIGLGDRHIDRKCSSKSID